MKILMMLVIITTLLSILCFMGIGSNKIDTLMVKKALILGIVYPSINIIIYTCLPSVMSTVCLLLILLINIMYLLSHIANKNKF